MYDSSTFAQFPWAWSLGPKWVRWGGGHKEFSNMKYLWIILNEMRQGILLCPLQAVPVYLAVWQDLFVPSCYSVNKKKHSRLCKVCQIIVNNFSELRLLCYLYLTSDIFSLFFLIIFRLSNFLWCHIRLFSFYDLWCVVYL